MGYFRIIIIATLIVVSFIVGCNKQIDTYKDIELLNELYNIRPEVPFRLDTICKKDWDSLYIVKPYEYSRIENSSFHIPINIREHIKRYNLFDSFCTLTFFKGKTFVCYSEIPCEVAIFSDLDENCYPASHEFYIDSLRFVRKVDY